MIVSRFHRWVVLTFALSLAHIVIIVALLLMSAPSTRPSPTQLGPFRGAVLFTCAVYATPVSSAILAALWVHWRHPVPMRAGRCQRCGYDLAGNTSGRCPECGQTTRRVIAAEEAHTKGRGTDARPE
ncbi:MAG TPA: hypothetical protein VGM03_00565 [Phycisphaerae bacterium]|jgi:hypothetical protein